MATTYNLSGSLALALSATLTQKNSQTNVADKAELGSGSLTKLSRTLANGTGASQGTNSWHDQRTVTTGANDDLVLNGGSLSNAFGVALAFTNIKWALLRITNPAATKKLVLGNHPTAPWQAWFGATSQTEEFRVATLKVNDLDGWTVSPPLAAPVAAPGSSTSASGGTIPAATYVYEVTYTNAAGETVASPTSTVTTTGTTSTITINSPPSATGATGWRAYVASGASGCLYVLQGSTTAIGTNQTFTSIASSGTAPPASSTAYSNNTLRVNNPGATSLTYDVLLIGS